MSPQKVITGFYLPPTFPDWLIPDNETKFLAHLIGMSLTEAIANAAARGLQPSTEVLLGHGQDMHHFTLIMDGMVVPLAVRLSDQADAGKVVH